MLIVAQTFGAPHVTVYEETLLEMVARGGRVKGSCGDGASPDRRLSLIPCWEVSTSHSISHGPHAISQHDTYEVSMFDNKFAAEFKFFNTH